MRRVQTLCFAIAHLAAAVALSDAASAALTDKTTTQLPRTVRPTHYDVAIAPNAQAMTFDGKVTIAIEVLQSTNSIKLNALDIAIRSVSLSDAANTSDIKPTVQIGAADQTITFAFDRPLAVGKYRLKIDYQGKIGTQANGLFAIDYDTAAGKKRALYTQFENSDARRVIPSWDEPAYKATFTLEATVPSSQMAVSNMPVTQRTDVANNLSRVRFAQSPTMSTYLLFFGLGEFDRATAHVGSTEVGVVTQKGAAAQAAFVLTSSQAILREYNDYFATPYPLPKLDNIASPGSSRFFAAMENWGAIYSFESAMLLDPTISTPRDKQGAFSTAAHEIAHQWFGNLVTMSWWDDLWLNEGFATWMADRTTRLLHPEWNTELNAVGAREAAIGRDSIATTHPVVQHVETVEQASQAFDTITYQKGAAVIRMLEGYVGADAWRTGVRQYIKKHAYGNTVSDDLWREIESAANKPVLAIAHDFTLQPGVPMISVGKPACIDGKTLLPLTQGEFSRDQLDKKPLKWRVPVIVQGASGAAVRTVVTDGKATVTVPGCALPIVNAGQSGYYRTLYSSEHFSQIAARFAALPAIDQLGILSDAWSLGRNGQQPVTDALDLANAIPQQADPQIWGQVAGILNTLNDDYVGTGARRDTFRAYAIRQLTPILARVGWLAQPNELDTVAILRTQLIGTLSELGDRTVIEEARKRYRASEANATAIPAALRKTILAVVAQHADAATWEQLHKAALNEKTPLVKDRYYGLLSSTEDQALARRALDLALTEEPGATNSAGMIARVAGRHPDLAFDFAMAHLDQVNLKVDSNGRNQYYPGLGSGSVDPAMIEKIKTFAAVHVAASSQRAADTAIARIVYRLKVRDERLPSIDAWLAKQKPTKNAALH